MHGVSRAFIEIWKKNECNITGVFANNVAMMLKLVTHKCSLIHFEIFFSRLFPITFGIVSLSFNTTITMAHQTWDCCAPFCSLKAPSSRHITTCNYICHNSFWLKNRIFYNPPKRMKNSFEKLCGKLWLIPECVEINDKRQNESI